MFSPSPFLTNLPNRAFMKILHVFASYKTLFTSFYMMHKKFYLHANMTAAGKFYKNFPCNIQNLNAEVIFPFQQNFPAAC